MENEILTPIDDEKIIQELTCPICLSIVVNALNHILLKIIL